MVLSWKIQIGFPRSSVAEGKIKHKKEEVYAQFRLQECWLPFVGHLFLCFFCRVYVYAVIHMNRHTGLGLRFGAIKCGYNIDEEQFLGIRILFQSACNMMMYSTII